MQVDKPSTVELKSLGATISVVDYDDQASLVAALQGVEVVVSAVTTSSISAQTALVDAAKAAGVKVFAPSYAARALLLAPAASRMGMTSVCRTQ